MNTKTQQAISNYINSKKELSFDGIDRSKVYNSVIAFIEKGGNPRTYTEEIMQFTGYEYDLCNDILLNSLKKYQAITTKEKMIAAGILAFEWSDSGDKRVCSYCSQRNGKVYFFSDNPVFPGELEGCRCIAYALDEFELADYLNKSI
ncbi:hypothetical protein CI088_00060 [Enterococcus plantarum]|uniref:Phage head morphogenesis domain-containing protein n=1 Tax=Enterococcus plantarum TaxID=1077675 RepID=A0A2W3ZLD2_9ENTE|nr:minor capsid protein [Enterococcus plantarum]PZL78200.1 hypothetical protein CI088_00060 [Enterococcus plantarum]